MKTKFKDIKGILKKEEMKEIVGGDVYRVGGANFAEAKYVGGSLTPAGMTTLGMIINYGQNGYRNYSSSFNYGAGANGSYASGNPANTFVNGGNTLAPIPPKGYAQP
jgi:hypothetical protein